MMVRLRLRLAMSKSWKTALEIAKLIITALLGYFGGNALV